MSESHQSESYFNLAANLARQSSAQLRALDTPIVKEMRRTARELGIVELLLEHQRIVYQQPAKAWDLVEDALLRLGATNSELMAAVEAAKP